VEAERGQRGKHRVRVEETIYDGVIRPWRLEERARVVDDLLHSRIVVWLLRVESPAEIDDPAIDVDGRDATVAVAQRSLRVVPRARPEHERAAAIGVDLER